VRDPDEYSAVVKSQKTLLIVLAFAFFVLSSCGGKSADSSAEGLQTLNPGELSVCLYPGFAPFAIENQDGTWGGWDPDYLSNFAKQQGLKLKPVEISSFDNIWMRPGNDECDIAATGITKTADRVTQVGSASTWTSVYYSVARGLAVKEGVTVNSIQDLAGHVVMSTKGSTADIDLASRIKNSGISNITVVYADGQDDAAKAVLGESATGPIGFAEGVGSVQQIVKENPGLTLAWQHCLMLPDGTISSEPFSFPVRAKSTGLANAMSSFIEKSSNAYPGGPGSGRDCPTGS